jgi:replicative DNA helicase
MTNQNLFSQDAEEALLGAAIVRPDLIHSIELRPGNFYIRRCGFIWSVLQELSKSGTVDIITISEKLKERNKLKDSGGLAYLTKLISETPSSTNAGQYAEIVKDYSRRRNMVEIAKQITMSAYDTQEAIQDKLPQFISEISSVSSVSQGAYDFKDALSRFYDDLINRMENPKDVWGIGCGLPGIDRVTGGFQHGEMMIISGRPGVGKSIMAMQMAVAMAKQSPGVIYSIEMGELQTTRRLVSARSKIQTSKMKSGKISAEELETITKMMGEMANLPVKFSDHGDWNTATMRADLSRLKAQEGIEWFVVDYLRLLTDCRHLGQNDRSIRISEETKRTCKQLNLAGLCVDSQNKQGISGENPPDQSSLSGSAQKIYDADMIMFLQNYIKMPNDAFYTHEQTQNMRTLTWGKGRELENDKRFVHLIKQDTYPAFVEAKTI